MTLNQIIKRLKSLAEAHKQVNSFYYGDISEFEHQPASDVNYPIVVVTHDTGTVSRTNKNREHNLIIYFLDLINVADQTEKNKEEVLSDMVSVMEDFVALMNSNDFQFTWSVSQDNNFTLIVNGNADVVGGAALQITVGVDNTTNRCQVPADDITSDTNYDLELTQLYNYTASGGETSIVITDLINKTILGVYRNQSFLRPISTNPTDTRQIKYVPQTGTFTLCSGDFLNVEEELSILYR